MGNPFEIGPHPDQTDARTRIDRVKPLKLITGPNKILETVCRPDFVIPEWLIPAMFALLRERRGYGLAAPQVGIDARLFVTAWREVYINPVVTWRSDHRVRVHETCLSFPDIVTEMTRRSSIEICGRTYLGVEAITLQHELDHLNGLHIAMKGVT